MVIDLIDMEDALNGGHLDCARIVWSDGVVRVTSRKWLVLV